MTKALAAVALLALVAAGCDTGRTTPSEIVIEGVSHGLVMAAQWTLHGPAVNEGVACPSASLVSGSLVFSSLEDEETSLQQINDQLEAVGVADYLATFTIECDDGSGSISISEITHMEAHPEYTEEVSWAVHGGTGAYDDLAGGGTELSVTEEEDGLRTTYSGTVSSDS